MILIFFLSEYVISDKEFTSSDNEINGWSEDEEGIHTVAGNAKHTFSGFRKVNLRQIQAANFHKEEYPILPVIFCSCHVGIKQWMKPTSNTPDNLKPRNWNL